MVVPRTEMWKKERNRVKGWEIKSLVWDMLNLRLLSIHPMGGDDWAACYISLELRGQVRAGDINLGVISI